MASHSSSPLEDEVHGLLRPVPHPVRVLVQQFVQSHAVQLITAVMAALKNEYGGRVVEDEEESNKSR